MQRSLQRAFSIAIANQRILSSFRGMESDVRWAGHFEILGRKLQRCKRWYGAACVPNRHDRPFPRNQFEIVFPAWFRTQESKIRQSSVWRTQEINISSLMFGPIEIGADVSFPTPSYTAATPTPLVIFFTASTTLSFVYRMTWSAPCCLAISAFSGVEVVPIIFAPSIFAI